MFDSISWAADAIISETDITLSFRDRLKLLLGASLALRTVVATENLVGGPHAAGRRRRAGAPPYASRTSYAHSTLKQEGRPP
jgi:hypothetical protein